MTIIDLFPEAHCHGNWTVWQSWSRKNVPCRSCDNDRRDGGMAFIVLNSSEAFTKYN